MSKVISFRLNSNNPREAQALTIMNAWLVEGYSVRHIITEAIHLLDDRSNKEEDTNPDFVELALILKRINVLLEQRESENIFPSLNGDNQKLKLPVTFLSSVKQAAKPGLKMS